MNENSLLTRYDRNLANNIQDFDMYEGDALLIKNIIHFMSADINHQIVPEDIFGRKILDPVIIAKTLGYKNPRSLMKPHPKPAQFKGKSKAQIDMIKKEAQKNGEILWNTELCNAIYRLRYEPLRFTKTGKTPDGLETSLLSELRILSYAKKLHDPKTNKIFYEVEYDEAFKNNLARFFLKLFTNAFIKLRKPGLQDLYIYLVNLRDIAEFKCKKEGLSSYYIDSVNFNFLASLIRCKSSEPREIKRAIKNAFKKVNHAINQENETFKLKWEKAAGHRQFYKPIIYFSFSPTEIIDKEKESNQRLYQYFIINIRKRFREYFFDNVPLEHHTPEIFESNFLKFLNNDTDSNIIHLKMKTLRNTHILVFGKDIELYDNKTSKRAIELSKMYYNEIMSNKHKLHSLQLF